MKTIDGIVRELGEIASSLQKRKAATTNGDKAKDATNTVANVANKMASTVSRAIANLDALDPTSARLLYEAIGAADLGDAISSQLTAAVDCKLESCLDEVEQASRGAQQTQHLLNPEEWMIEELYTLSSSKKSLDMKMQACADYLVRCGIWSPSEKTCGMWLSFIVCMHFETLPQYDKLFSYLTDFKAMIIASRKTTSFPTIWNYPRSPEMLPEATHVAIFGDELVPFAVSIPKLKDVFENHMPLRKTSKLLKQNTVGDRSSMTLNSTPQRPSTGKSGRRSGSWASNSVKSEVKSESSPLTSVKQEEDDGDVPAWASELLTSLKETTMPMSAKAEPAIKKAMTGLVDGPSWAQELHSLLEGHCSKAAAEREQLDEPQPERLNIRKRLCPKGNLSLRMSAAAHEDRDSLAEFGQSLDDMDLPPSRLTMQDYEERSMNALKSVQTKRAEKAKLDREAKKQAEKDAEVDKNKPKEAKTTKGAKPSTRRRLNGKQPAPHFKALPAKNQAAKPVVQKAVKKAAKAWGRIRRPASVFNGALKPACPHPENRDPIEYHGGKLYNTKRSLRVLRNKSDNYSEKSWSHGKWELETSFAAGLQSIDDYWEAIRQRLPEGEDVD